jgi:hypothetical protein
VTKDPLPRSPSEIFATSSTPSSTRVTTRMPTKRSPS